MTFEMRPKGLGRVMGSPSRGNRHVKPKGPKRMQFTQELRATQGDQKVESVERGGQKDKRTCLKDLVCLKALVGMS